MKTTGITSVDHAPQVVAEWLNELGDNLGWNDKPRSYLLLRETLHAVRDYLSPDEAADLAAQLPILIRGIYYEGWAPSRTPAHPRAKHDFLARVGDRFSDDPLEDPEAAVVAVFDLLRRKLSPGAVDQVAHAMRKSLRDLWL
jgi:uncharacterized protein (DUF2267 family)